MSPYAKVMPVPGKRSRCLLWKARRLKFGMQVVLATRNPVTRPMVVRAGPDLARASPECHRSIFWGMGRG